MTGILRIADLDRIFLTAIQGKMIQQQNLK